MGVFRGSLAPVGQDGELDLNSAASNLNVQKRRVYDIVNVLEGIQVVSKTSKNRIRWSRWGGADPNPSSGERLALEQERCFGCHCLFLVAHAHTIDPHHASPTVSIG